MPDSDELLEALVAMADCMASGDGLDATLQQVAALARRSIEACDMAAITLLRDGKPVTAAFSGMRAPQVDSIQYETGIGPCLDAYRLGSVMRIPSTRGDERWEAFSRAAVHLGVASTLSFPLAHDGEVTGALNLYSGDENGFDEAQEELAARLARLASVSLHNAELYRRAHQLGSQLKEALESRDVIGQAKGILMARRSITNEEAFELLRDASQRSNRKLRDVAEETAFTGELPAGAGRARRR